MIIRIIMLIIIIIMIIIIIIIIIILKYCIPVQRILFLTQT